MTQAFDAVLLLAFGGPTRSEEIRPFLDNVLRGRPVPPERYEEVVRHYLEVGGSSPIARLTESQAEGLRSRLASDGSGLTVFVGMRHWHPYVSDTLATMAAGGLRRAVGIVLAAHPSPPSREAYRQAVEEGRRRVGATAPEVDFVGEWHDHPLLVAALADRLCDALAAVPADRRARAALVFTAHSLPAAMSETSGYETSLRRTAELVARAAGVPAWRLAWQSRSGSPRDPWLEPDVRDVIADVARDGSGDVVVAPIGFVCDHVEILYDLDVEARAAARAAGIGFHRAATAGTHPAFLDLLAELVRGRLGGRTA
ncbi:MAG TPA: ferrochelatase [Patescibacteria group bacterium]|nr:ferrochelatase [Patescibacteria group bacterium]